MTAASGEHTVLDFGRNGTELPHHIAMQFRVLSESGCYPTIADLLEHNDRASSIENFFICQCTQESFAWIKPKDVSFGKLLYISEVQRSEEVLSSNLLLIWQDGDSSQDCSLENWPIIWTRFTDFAKRLLQISDTTEFLSHHHTSDIHSSSQVEGSDEAIALQRDIDLQNPGAPEQLHQHNSIYEIPSILASDVVVSAVGDYCSRGNFMQESYAKLLNLTIQSHEPLSVTVGSGLQVHTTGTVEVSYRFQSEPEVYKLQFHLLPNCIHDIILGKPFLKATKTYSVLENFAKRVTCRLVNTITSCDMLYLGDSGPRFRGLLNDFPSEALADSGSKVAIMDEEYAHMLGLDIDSAAILRLRFADGSRALTSEVVRSVGWQFGMDESSSLATSLDFHILKSAPADIILSESFLFSVNAFAAFADYLADEEDEDDEAYLLAIDVDATYRLRETSHLPDIANHAELIRRGEEDDRIADLPVAEQHSARLIENASRLQSDTQTQAPTSSDLESSNGINLVDAANSGTVKTSKLRTPQSRLGRHLKSKLKRKP